MLFLQLFSIEGNFILLVAHTKKPGKLLDFLHSLPPPTSSNKQFCVHSIFRIWPLLSTLIATILATTTILSLELSWQSNSVIILFKIPVFSLLCQKKLKGFEYSPRPIHNLSFPPCSWSVTCPKAFVNAVCSVSNALLPRLRPSLPGTLIKKSLSFLPKMASTYCFLPPSPAKFCPTNN